MSREHESAQALPDEPLDILRQNDAAVGRDANHAPSPIASGVCPRDIQPKSTEPSPWLQYTIPLPGEAAADTLADHILHQAPANKHELGRTIRIVRPRAAIGNFSDHVYALQNIALIGSLKM